MWNNFAMQNCKLSGGKVQVERKCKTDSRDRDKCKKCGTILLCKIASCPKGKSRLKGDVKRTAGTGINVREMWNNFAMQNCKLSEGKVQVERKCKTDSGDRDKCKKCVFIPVPIVRNI